MILSSTAVTIQVRYDSMSSAPFFQGYELFSEETGSQGWLSEESFMLRGCINMQGVQFYFTQIKLNIFKLFFEI